ncbi:hypothetical protein T492DRAFT_1144881 [Pavlovales sp. CCMP2436]|nr:hypothetical protein T492DRAFT_1144881 [Pavlovales sp. CCMP2436]
MSLADDEEDEDVPWWRRVAQNSQTLWSLVSDDADATQEGDAGAVQPSLSQLFDNLDAVIDNATDTDDRETLPEQAAHATASGPLPVRPTAATESSLPPRVAKEFEASDEGDGEQWDEWPSADSERAAQPATPTSAELRSAALALSQPEGTPGSGGFPGPQPLPPPAQQSPRNSAWLPQTLSGSSPEASPQGSSTVHSLAGETGSHCETPEPRSCDGEGEGEGDAGAEGAEAEAGEGAEVTPAPAAADATAHTAEARPEPAAQSRCEGGRPSAACTGSGLDSRATSGKADPTSSTSSSAEHPQQQQQQLYSGEEELDDDEEEDWLDSSQLRPQPPRPPLPPLPPPVRDERHGEDDEDGVGQEAGEEVTPGLALQLPSRLSAADASPTPSALPQPGGVGGGLHFGGPLQKVGGFSLGRLSSAFDARQLVSGALEAVGASAMRAIARDESGARFAVDLASRAGGAGGAGSRREGSAVGHSAAEGLGEQGACEGAGYEASFFRRGCAMELQRLEGLRCVSARSLALKAARLPPVQRAAVAGSWAAIEGLLGAEWEQQAGEGGDAARNAKGRRSLLPPGAGPDASALVAAALGALVRPELAALRPQLANLRGGVTAADGARACCGAGLALCASASLRLLGQLGARCLQAAESEEGDLLAELGAAAVHFSGAGAAVLSAAQLTGAAFPFATGVERALWAAQWANEWGDALLDAASDWADECGAAAGRASRGGGAADDALLRCKQDVGALATHVHEARIYLLPCLKYTALSDVL